VSLDDLDGLEAELQRDAATRQQRLAATQQAAHPASATEGSVRPCYPGVQEWVAAVFSPTFARRSTPTFTWCAQWWRHPEHWSGSRRCGGPGKPCGWTRCWA
jgi:hypothetical protein